MLGVGQTYLFNLPVDKKRLSFVVLTILYCVLIIVGCRDYFQWTSGLSIAGFLVLIFLFTVKEVSAKRNAYFYMAIACIFLTLLLPVKTFLFFSIVFSFLLVSEALLSKNSPLTIGVFIVISPIFNYFITVFTFPIRLWLSQLTVKTLSLLNSSVQQNGNIITRNNIDFSVDAECMGLNMASIGLLTAIFLLGFYQKRIKRQLTFFPSILFLAGVFVLVILANLFRIVLIVQFQISEESLLHELIGDFCFIGYVILPATLYIQRSIKKHTGKLQSGIAPSSLSDRKFMQVIAVSTSLILLTGYVVNQKGSSKKNSYSPAPYVFGFKSELIEKDVFKLGKEGVLIYVKHIKSFYSTEHSPMICWKGSGYKLNKIKEENILGKKTYSAELIKGKDILYTCWWFDNGECQTIDQLQWRWKVLTGAKEFSIVNVTSGNRPQLLKNVSEILSGNLIGEMSKNNVQ